MSENMEKVSISHLDMNRRRGIKVQRFESDLNKRKDGFEYVIKHESSSLVVKSGFLSEEKYSKLEKFLVSLERVEGEE
jgi:hypothetical protein